MQQPDGRIQRNDWVKLSDPGEKNISGQNLLEMFGALRRTVDEEDRNSGGDNIDHADQRLLRKARGPSPGEGQQHRCKQRERERISVGGRALAG